MSGRFPYARHVEAENISSGINLYDEMLMEDNSDYIEDDEDDEDDEAEDILLQDALERMVAQAEARNSFGTQYDDDQDTEYIPSDQGGSVYQDLIQDAGGLEIQMAEDDDESDYDDEDDEEDDESPFRRGQSLTIDIRDLLRAHLDTSNDDESNRQDDSDLNARESIARAFSGIGITGLQRLIAVANAADAIDRGEFEDDDDDHGDEEDEDNWYHMARSTQMANFWDPTTEPIRSGQELALGGEYGRQPKRPLDAAPSAFAESINMVDLIQERKYARRRISKADMASFVPNTNGTVVASYPARVYCGQYSQDSSFFYTCTQDFRVHMYDTTLAGPKTVQVYDDGPRRDRNSWFFSSAGATQHTSLNLIKSIQGRQGNWTITDANLSPDNQWMVYSSITPYVHLVPTKQTLDTGGRMSSDHQVMLDFSNTGDDDTGVRWRSAVRDFLPPSPFFFLARIGFRLSH